MQDNATSDTSAAPPRLPNPPPETIPAALRRAAGRIKCADVHEAVNDALLSGGELEISLTFSQPAEGGPVRMSLSLRERAPKRSLLRFRNIPMPAGAA